MSLHFFQKWNWDTIFFNIIVKKLNPIKPKQAGNAILFAA